MKKNDETTSLHIKLLATDEKIYFY